MADQQNRIKPRQDTATNWTSNNPIMASGEHGYETDNLISGTREESVKFKIGDGINHWNDLPYELAGTTLLESLADISVRFATTGNLTATYANGTAGVGRTLTKTTNGAFPTTDGIVPALGDQVLIWKQTDKTENGVYVITTLGTGGTPWVLTGDTSGDEQSELDEQVVFVILGNAHGNKYFTQATTLPVVGTDNIVYKKGLGKGVAIPDNQIAVGTGDSIEGQTDFTYDAATKTMAIGNPNEAAAPVGNLNLGSTLRIYNRFSLENGNFYGYPDGFFDANIPGRYVTIGDPNGNHNNIYIRVDDDDAAQSITLCADTFKIGAPGFLIDYVFPTALGSAGDVLTDVAGDGVLSWAAGGGGYTDEQAQDAVGSILSAEFSYDDPTPGISINSIAATKITGTKTSAFISDLGTVLGDYLTEDGATTGATAQAQVFTNGIKAGVIDDNATSELAFTISTIQKASIDTTGIGLIDGTAANPSYSWINDKTTGLYLKSATEIGASIGGALTGGFDATGLFAGLSGTLTGQVKISGATSGTAILTVAAAAGTPTLTLPTTSGTLATQAYADALVVGLLDDRGNHDASTNLFPSSGGSGTAGAILKGDLWTISVAGTLGGHPVTAGDVVRALVDTPGATDANWAITENNFGYVALNQSLADGKIYVGNGSGIGTAVTPSGDVTMTNAGVMAIGADKVLISMIADIELKAIAGLTSAADKVPVFTGIGTAELRTKINTPLASYAGTITWPDGSLAPSTLLSAQFAWSEDNGWCDLTIAALYSVAGTSNTLVTFTLPAGCPTPATIAGIGAGADDVMYHGTGGIEVGKTTQPSNARCFLSKNATNDGYLISVKSGAANAKVARATIQYRVS